MAKTCACCGKEMGMFNGKVQVKDIMAEKTTKVRLIS